MSLLQKLLRPNEWSAPTAVVLVLVAGLLAYGTSLWGVFLYDDIHSIVNNKAVRELGNIPQFFADVTMFSDIENNMYRPVLLTSFAINYAQGDGAVWAFKLTDLLLHLMTATMLFAIARRLGVSIVGAAFAGALFVVHPLCSEAIHMVSSRSEQLLVFGLCAALLAFDSARTARGAARVGWSFLTVAACVIACGSKETGVLTPAFLLAWEWLRRTRGPGLSLRAVLPGAIAVLPVVCVTVGYLLARKQLLGAATVATLPPVTGGEVVMFGWGRDMTTQLATMAASAPRFLAQCFAPLGLGLDPPLYWFRSPWALLPLGGAVLIALWTALGLFRPRSRPAVAMGTVFAWGTCFPWMVVPLNQPLAEHRAYGLVLGFSLAMGAWVGRRAERAAVESTKDRRQGPSSVLFRRLVARWAPAAACALFAVGSAVHGLRFASEEGLWRHTLAVNPQSFHAPWGIGAARLVAGDGAGAREHLLLAHTRHPHYRTPQSQLVDAYLIQGAEDGAPYAALALVDRLLEHDGSNPYWRVQKARVLLQVAELSGRDEPSEQAEQLALSCLEIATPKALVFRVAAMARRQLGDLEGAIAHLEESERRGLDYFAVFLERARCREELGDWSGAERDLVRAAQRAPGNPHVMSALEGLAGRRAAAPPR